MSRQHYIINDETMYIVAKSLGRYTESVIGELYGEPIQCLSIPNKILEHNCKYHFQTYASRKDLTRSLSGIRSKHPIILDLFGSYIYFCTHSDRVSENCWFNLRYIDSYYDYNGNTKIKFENNEEMEINISYSSFNNQYLNAVKLHYKFNLAKEKTYRKDDTQRAQSSGSRAAFIEKTLIDLEAFASASAPPKAPDVETKDTSSDKEAVKTVVDAVKAGSDLSVKFPGAIPISEITSLKRVVKCSPKNTMKQKGGYYTVVWDCGSKGALGMKVVVSRGTVDAISTMELVRKPNAF